MIKKIIILNFVLAVLGNAYGQKVGINTENPTSVLDVNGNIRTNENLLVGGDEDTGGSPGTAGQLLISRGAGQPPQWETVTTPIPDTGDWYLMGSLSRVDTKGGFKIDYSLSSGATNYDSKYSVNQPNKNMGNKWLVAQQESRPWYEFEDFTFDLPQLEDSVRLVINVQVLAQAYWVPGLPRESWMSYAIGVFKEIPPPVAHWKRSALMLNSRQGGCNGSETANTPQELMTFIHTVTLPPNEAAKIMIMGTQRANQGVFTGSYITIGHLLDGGPDDSLLRRANMRVDIYRKVKR